MTLGPEAEDPHPVPRLPSGAADTHAHVLGPFDRYPHGPSSYDVPEAPRERYLKMLASLGLDRGVLVQPGPYGTNTRLLEDAIADTGGRLVGVGVARPEVSDDDLARMDARGVRGLRFIAPRGDAPPPPGSVPPDELPRMVSRLRDLGWHVDLWADSDTCAHWGAWLAERDVAAVLDHLAQPDLAAGPTGAGFAAVTRLVESGAVHVKSSLCRVGSARERYAEARPFYDALLEADPGRLLWASDWPFVRLSGPPHVGELLGLFAAWTPPEHIDRILVDNPEHFYGFANER